MPRKKAASNCTISPWLSAKGDNKEGRFLQVGNSLLLSKQFQSLSASAQILYMCMALEGGGQRELTFTHGCAKKYGISESTFDRRIKELKQAGFIEAVPDENQAQYSPNRFKFCFAWKTTDTASLKIIRKEPPP